MTLHLTSTTDQKEELLLQYGDRPLAYSTLQPTLRTYLRDTGYLAYATATGLSRGSDHNLILGDPIAAESNWGSLLDQFLDGIKDATFFQVGESCAQHLHQKGFRIAPFGYESTIRLPFNLHGKYRGDVRRMINRAAAAGVSVRELNAEERRRSGVTDQEINLLVEKWLRSKVVHQSELKFLARPFVAEDELHVRKFYAICGGQLCGLAVYDPMFRAGEIIGYAESIVRVDPDAPDGTRDLLLRTALEEFGREDYDVCSLGLTPLAPLPAELKSEVSVPHNKMARMAMRTMYHLLNNIAFNFKGTEFKKRRYVRSELAEEVSIRPVFIASPRRLILSDAYRLAKVMGISPIKQLVQVPTEMARRGMNSLPAPSSS